jgi:hypothetical protein
MVHSTKRQNHDDYSRVTLVPLYKINWSFEIITFGKIYQSLRV